MKTYLPFAAILFLSACSESPRTTHEDAGKPPVPVQTMTAQTHAVPLLYTATGTVHPRTESQLSSQMMARVTSVKVHVGDHVAPGQLLISLDSQEATAAYQKAEAGRAESQSAIAEADNNIAQAKANLDLAKLTAQRMSDLFAKRSISQQEMDETNAKLKNAQASYEMARARREQLNNRIAENDASLQEAQTTRGYSSIHAPFAGIVTARNVDPGAMAMPGVPLLTIESGTGYRFHADLEESQIANVHLNDTVSVFLDALQREIPARVAEISPITDARSHSFTVKMDLPANAIVRAGQFGHVSFITGNKQAVTVPTSAVTEHGQLQSVFVNDHGTARIRLVTLGESREGQMEVLSGLEADDHIINPIPNGLADGDRVEDRQ
jgi:membrane fusion protein, multidrug efflux system